VKSYEILNVKNALVDLVHCVTQYIICNLLILTRLI
jgi:hypothetical protein